MVSNTSLSTSPVGSGVSGAGDVARGVVDAKSRGIGGSILVLGGDCEPTVGVEVSAGGVDAAVAETAAAPFSSFERVPSARTVCAWEETLKKEEEPLLGLVTNVAVPEGRLGRSLSFSFSLSAVDGRSLLLSPNDSFEVFLTIERRECFASSPPEPDDSCFW